MQRSFDLFDTLLGRLQYYPDSIFYLVQERFPFPGFALFRMLAESQSDRSLPDIYRHFQALTGISKSTAIALMECEFQTELSQIFPITENLRQVSDGDLIISDTYYSTEQVEQIVKKIGLDKRVHIHATTRGKSSGHIWGKLKQHIALHLGDSLHADVAMPQAHNIPAVHYTDSQLSSQEQKVAALGKPKLSFLMRTLRLSNPYSHESLEHRLWNDQCQINIPLLIEASLFLDQFCRQNNKKRILFTSRDGCLWIQIFRCLFPDYEALNFHSSRYMYMFPTPDFIKYVKNIHTDETLIVDSHGTGISCTLFFKQHLKMRPIYLSIVNPKKRQHAILRTNRLHETIEKLNYDLVGSLYNFKDEQPMRSELEYDPRFVLPSHLCVKHCTQLLPEYDLGTFNRPIIRYAASSARKTLAIDTLVDHAIYHTHINDSSQTRHVHVLQSGGRLELNS